MVRSVADEEIYLKGVKMCTSFAANESTSNATDMLVEHHSSRKEYVGRNVELGSSGTYGVRKDAAR